MNSRKTTLAVIVLLSVNLAATALLGFIVLRSCRDQKSVNAKSSQYVMYIGTNDKDTYEQIISTEEAKKIVDGICFKYLGGYTIQDAIGSWVDDDGNPTHENTIVCYFDDTDSETVHKIADEVIAALNQNSVLIETDSIQIEFYG